MMEHWPPRLLGAAQDARFRMSPSPERSKGFYGPLSDPPRPERQASLSTMAVSASQAPRAASVRDSELTVGRRQGLKFSLGRATPSARITSKTGEREYQ